MPKLRIYRLFISHCWEYADDYHCLVRWFDEERLFIWKDLSVPEESAMREDEAFESRLRKRVVKADILLVIIGMEISYRYWIKREINWARLGGIPIIGVMPNGGRRIPRAIDRSGCPIVGWRRNSVISAIRTFAPAKRQNRFST